MMHVGHIGVHCSILRDVGIPNMVVVTRARGLRSADASRPGDVVMVLDFFVEGRHLVLNVIVATVYRNAVIQRVAPIPGYYAKQAKNRKLLTDTASAEPIATIHGGPHGIVPFAIDDVGRLTWRPCPCPLLHTAPMPFTFLRTVGLHVGPTLATTHVHMTSHRHLQACHKDHMP